MILFCLTVIAVLVLDFISKSLVASGMVLNSSVSIIPGFLDLTYIVNDGAAWGILAGKQTLLQIFTAVLIIALIAYAVAKRRSLSHLEFFSLALIAGGGLGNFISRVSKGCVVDFIDIHIIPIFNVADIAITVGCVLLLASALIPSKKTNNG